MKVKFVILSFLLLLSGTAHLQGLRVQDKTIVDNKGHNVVLRGIGLGGWMLQEPYMLQLSGMAKAQYDIRNKIAEIVGAERAETFYNRWLSSHCTRADIDSLAAWGFNSVRLPMHYNLFTLPVEKEPVKGQQTWLPTGFALTDSLLAWCKANRIYLILDLHAAPGGQGADIPIADRDTTLPSLWASEANQQKTIALWEKLAARYAGEEWIGAYDILNEPNYGFANPGDKNGCAEKDNGPLKTLYQNITTAIRKVDQKHIIIIEGNCWGNNYNGMFPLWDKNIVLSFHKYWNYTDQNSLQNILSIRDAQNAPVWCGETGENSNVWFTDNISLLERNNIGWAMWPLKKMGSNNPLQVPANAAYQQLVDYWKGKGTKPPADAAYEGLLQLCADSRTANNIVHRDVVDAMIRQVRTPEVIPYKRLVLQQTTTVYASDYDLGRNGHAYADKDTGNYWVSTTKRTDWNSGHQYRNDGVDIGACTDTVTNGYYVGWTQDGEWLQYTVANPKAGWFDLSLRTSGQEGKAQWLVNGQPAGAMTLPATAGDAVWQTTTLKRVQIPQGTVALKVLAQQGGFNLNYLQLNRIN